jgi:hypothetical protein
VRRFRSRHVNLPDIEDWAPYVEGKAKPEMEAYDQLPPRLRKRVREAVEDTDTVRLLREPWRTVR